MPCPASCIVEPSAVVDVRLVEPRREPDVAAVGTAAEGVRRDVEPAAAEVEPDLVGDEADEGLLLVDRQRQLVEGVARRRRAAEQIREQRLQSVAERGEDHLDLARRAARLVVLGERVPRLAVVGPAVALGLAVHQVDDLLEPGLEAGEVGVLAGLAPLVLREARQLRLLGDELGGELRAAVVVAADLADVHRRDARRVGGDVAVGLAGVEPLADPGIGAQLVADPRELAELPTPVGQASGGHHDLLVPAQQGERPAEALDLARAVDELLIGRRGGRFCGGHDGPRGEGNRRL